MVYSPYVWAVTEEGVECLEAEAAVREGEGDAGQRERDVVEGRRLHWIFALLLVVRSGLFIIGLVHVVGLWRGKFE